MLLISSTVQTTSGRSKLSFLKESLFFILSNSLSAFAKKLAEFWGTSFSKIFRKLIYNNGWNTGVSDIVRLKIVIAHFGFKILPKLFEVFSC